MAKRQTTTADPAYTIRRPSRPLKFKSQKSAVSNLEATKKAATQPEKEAIGSLRYSAF